LTIERIVAVDSPREVRLHPRDRMAAFTAGAFVCLFAGLRRLGAVRTSIVAATEPLAAAALAVIFLSERLHAGTVLGGLLILAGAIAASIARQGPAAEPRGP